MSRFEAGSRVWVKDEAHPNLWALGRVVSVGERPQTTAAAQSIAAAARSASASASASAASAPGPQRPPRNGASTKVVFTVDLLASDEHDDAGKPRRLENTADVLAFDEFQLEDCPDALRMRGELHEAALLDLLRRRFAEKHIFTFAGDVLVSINPFCDVGALTERSPSPEEIHDLDARGAATPHLYVVAERVVSQMLSKGPNQHFPYKQLKAHEAAAKTESAHNI